MTPDSNEARAQPAGADHDDEKESGAPLPEPVRARVVEYGSEVLGQLSTAELPSALRRIAKFEPRRRARLAGPQIAAQLEADTAFRQRVAQRVQVLWPDLTARLGEGVVPPAAEPVTVAAVAYLLRPSGWATIVERVRDELDRREGVKQAEEAAETIADLRHRLNEAHAQHRDEVAQLRSQLKRQRSTIADLRRSLHAERQRAKEAVERSEEAIGEANERAEEAAGRVNAVESENRRLRNRLASAEAQMENARRAARAGRSADDARLRVLLDVLVDASHGLRRELALPTSIDSPADLAVDEERDTAAALSGPGLPDDDPGLIDQLLVLPRVHLLVDGYNVTKTGYGTLPLADQRARLLQSLEGLATRTKAEITCVFDGAEVEVPPASSVKRRVRLLFSDPTESADDLIVRLVRAEPPGRPLAVVTSDQEIVRAVRREGARTLASSLLLQRLEPAG
ncbi:NYN domain-containing protein [Salinactinospora qingdaonensis]|uniref:NYN domain-containing protein n=1 Tax=Salinactinospora qingdaonensis TaxID=702744 RepID=A0ABP7FHU4_9ACTN